MSFTYRRVLYHENDVTNPNLYANPETVTFSDSVAAGEWVLFVFIADPGTVVNGGAGGLTEPRIEPDVYVSPGISIYPDPAHGPGVGVDQMIAQDYLQPYNSIFFNGSPVLLALQDIPIGESALFTWQLTLAPDTVVTCGPRIYAAYVITPTPDFQDSGASGLDGAHFAWLVGGTHNQDTSGLPSVASSTSDTDGWLGTWGTDQIFFISLLEWENDALDFNTANPDQVVMDVLTSPSLAHGGAIILWQQTAVDGTIYTISGSLSGSAFWSASLYDLPLVGGPPGLVFINHRHAVDTQATGSAFTGAPIVLNRTRFSASD